jgi:hypothetical protein
MNLPFIPKTKHIFRNFQGMLIPSAHMKKVILKATAILCGLGGVVLIPTLFYNACGIAGIQDCADGPKLINALIVVMVPGLFVLSYWLFRRSRSEA